MGLFGRGLPKIKGIIDEDKSKEIVVYIISKGGWGHFKDKIDSLSKLVAEQKANPNIISGFIDDSIRLLQKFNNYVYAYKNNRPFRFSEEANKFFNSRIDEIVIAVNVISENLKELNKYREEPGYRQVPIVKIKEAIKKIEKLLKDLKDLAQLK